MKLQELRKLIREEVNKEMGKEIESTHYLELLKDLQETNDIKDEKEIQDFYDALIEFAESIKPNKSKVNENLQEIPQHVSKILSDIEDEYNDDEIYLWAKKGYQSGKLSEKELRDIWRGRLNPYISKYGYDPRNMSDEDKDEDYDGDMYAMRGGGYGRRGRWS